MINKIIGYSYRKLLKPFLFMLDPEAVHIAMTNFGEKLGKSRVVKKALNSLFTSNNSLLQQNIRGIDFANPIGLAAGFDYDAKLTQITPSIGFGMQSIGTITYQHYGGNATPRLGRLPKSKSLMVNKGFKNQGAGAIAKKLKNMNFAIPIGISIGRTNNQNLSQAASVVDIISTFKTFESN